jgi:hypothetical protein
MGEKQQNMHRSSSIGSTSGKQIMEAVDVNKAIYPY